MPTDVPAGFPDWLPWAFAVVAAMFIKPMWALINRLIFRKNGAANGGRTVMVECECPAGMEDAIEKLDAEQATTSAAITEALGALVAESKGSHEKLGEQLRDIADTNAQSVRCLQVTIDKQEETNRGISSLREGQGVLLDRTQRGGLK